MTYFTLLCTKHDCLYYAIPVLCIYCTMSCGSTAAIIRERCITEPGLTFHYNFLSKITRNIFAKVLTWQQNFAKPTLIWWFLHPHKWSLFSPPWTLDQAETKWKRTRMWQLCPWSRQESQTPRDKLRKSAESRLIVRSANSIQLRATKF